MMASAAVIGLSAGKRLLSSFYYSDLTEKLSCGYDYGSTYHQATSTKNIEPLGGGQISFEIFSGGSSFVTEVNAGKAMESFN
ncbi:hypothetical protein ACSBR1_040150 [Camellia fascicularis]